MRLYLRRWARRLVWMAAGLAVLAALIAWELRTSWILAHVVHRYARTMSFELLPGPSDAIRFPPNGPFNQRMGYRDLPRFVSQLGDAGYAVTTQARMSGPLLSFMDEGYFPIYAEKTQAGLRLLDRDENEIYAAVHPERTYANFDAIPPVIVDALLFIENRELLDVRYPYRNPAVEWDRFLKAVSSLLTRPMRRAQRSPGGSTLATQLEKMRYSPEGRTASAREKIRQMISASVRAYRDNPETTQARRALVRDYVNAVPGAAMPGFGEVIGLGDGLWTWYGADFGLVNQILKKRGDAIREAELVPWGHALKQAISLLIAQRRPTFYLRQDPQALERLTEAYLHLLLNARVLNQREYLAAKSAKLIWRTQAADMHPGSFVELKAVNSLRTRLLQMLDVKHLYDLDRLDLTVWSTLDQQAHDRVTDLLRQLGDTEFATAMGLGEERLLAKSDPARVIYSVTLYERVGSTNVLRIQTDNYDMPLNINEGVKLELGSSAKLRTLVSYLDIIGGLHRRYQQFSDERLREQLKIARSPLAQWVLRTLVQAKDRTLRATLDAAMERTFSCSPYETFFTGGGQHRFVNFDPKDDSRVVSVRTALYESINLPFVRMMRDVIRHYLHELQGNLPAIVENSADPRRQVYLERFVADETALFLRRFYDRYRRVDTQAALEQLTHGIRPTPVRLTVLFRSVLPGASVDRLEQFLAEHLPHSKLDRPTIEKLYERYAVGNFSLVDRAYLARVHPLELWAVTYLRDHRRASEDKVIAAGMTQGKSVYNWLLTTKRKRKQDLRIQILLEMEAFAALHQQWQRWGYPFASLVPSYATAIGSSADRPAALAELVGIIQSGGIRYPTQRIDEMRFAENTPFETHLRRHDDEAKGERVLAEEVADVVRDALIGVVENGTARRVRQSYWNAVGEPLAVGGKTGTGDNRHEVYDAQGRVIAARTISRTSVFVFFLGERHFGVITAYVAGGDAKSYSFTSALPVQVLKLLRPYVEPLINRELSYNPEQLPACAP